MAGRFGLLLDGIRVQRLSETEFVAVGVDQVEEALTPFGVAGHGSWLESRYERTVVKCVNIGNVEDYPPPVASWLRKPRLATINSPNC